MHGGDTEAHQCLDVCCHSGDAEEQGETEENIGSKSHVYEENGGQGSALQYIYDIEPLREHIYNRPYCF